MKINNEKTKGVLHRQWGADNYDLRRYFPNERFSAFIEQFWLVNWNLEEKKVHVQRNLPDPNFHLIIGKEDVKVLGPVSKAYSYSMQGAGRIIGVKFECGALKELLSQKISNYVDKEFQAQDIFGINAEETLLPLYEYESDSSAIQKIQNYLSSFVVPASAQKTTAQSLVSLIKNNEEIYRVEQVSRSANISTRAVQRHFAEYVGLSPKWLIRKYRLSRALEQLENNSVSIADVVAKLEYVDQSHLIRDFKQILGITPNRYIKPL